MRMNLVPSTNFNDYQFTHQLRTRFAETDAMGIIHHASYLAYLEETRVEFLRHSDHPYAKIREDGIDLAVLEVFVQYRKPLKFDEVVDVAMVIGGQSRATFQVAYLLSVDGDVRATAVTVHGAVDQSGRAVRLPESLSTNSKEQR